MLVLGRMPPIFTDIDSMQKETEQERKALEKLYGKLGRAVLSMPGDFRLPPDFPADLELVENVRTAQKAFSDASDRLAEMKNAMNEISEGGTRITRGRVRLKELEIKRQELHSVLGAVSAEIYDSGFFPEEMEFALSPLKEHRAEAQRLEKRLRNTGSSVVRMLIRHKLSVRSKRLESVYKETGRLISEADGSRLLAGERVESILLELDNIDKMKERQNHEIRRHSEMIDRARTSLGEGGAGFSSLKLKEAEMECARKKEDAAAKEAEYGRFLAASQNKWLDSSFPAEVVSCCDEIRRQQHSMYLRQLHSRMLSFEKAIDICEGRIAHYKEQIEYLDSQIEALQSQRSEIDSRIASERQNIESCRIQQKAIETLAQEKGDGSRQ